MSFSASAARVRDIELPLGLRARCLHECLEQFSVFGFNATRERLLVMAGLGVDDRWSEASLVNALEPLTHARRSWLAFAADDARARRADKRAGRPLSRVSERGIRIAWTVAHLEVAARAEEWLVTGLGDCPRCDHRVFNHGAHGCLACRDVAGSGHGEWCREALPPPG